MPAQASPLPDFIEWCPVRKKIKCLICAPYEPLELRQWIAKTNLRTHTLSQNHIQCVEMRQLAEQRQARTQATMARNTAEIERFAELAAPSTLAAPEKSQPSCHKNRSALEEAMWEDYTQNGADFHLGSSEEMEAERARALFEKRLEAFGFGDARATARDLGFSEDADPILPAIDEDEELLDEVLRNAFPPDPMPAMGESLPDTDAGWYPYESKTMFLLDTLDNLPRLRISSSLMKVFLWVLQETGAKNVPSFDHFRKTQAQLRPSCGIPTLPCRSSRGNVFHINDPAAIIAKDWANPLVRPHLRVYPEMPADGVVSEIWHAEKWRKDLDLDILSPMYDAGQKHFYVNELSRLKDGRWVIPIRWVTFRSKTHADAFLVTWNENCAVVHDEQAIFVCADELHANYYDLEASRELPAAWLSSSTPSDYGSRMPNPLRELAQGAPLYTSFVDYFGDDVSGNRSKSWNKHWNAYMTHRNLPRRLLQQEFHTHFLSTSQKATIPEQFLEFKRLIEVTHRSPVAVRDAVTSQTLRFRIYVNAEPSDNPMASEVSGHIGGQGNKYCRKCDAGGTDQEKESDDGFHSLFTVGAPRNKAQTLAQVEVQVALACRGVAQPIKDIQKKTGVKDMYTETIIEELLDRARNMKKENPARTANDIQAELLIWVSSNREVIYNPFLTLQGFDPATDTPIEILHTVLLGIVKYAWHATHTSWTVDQKNTYALRLQATNTKGLSIAPIRANYIMQYANSLIGRQFKIIAQLTIFCVHDLVSPAYLQLWKTIGILAALVWIPEISNITEYLVCNISASTADDILRRIEKDDLDTAVGNVLDSFADIDPSKITAKIKLHLSKHIREDVLRFGPLIGVCTEVFESFNAVFRSCSILSNHQAPSRDIARQLADQEGLKHRVTGGSWLRADGEWVCAGVHVREFLRTRSTLQSLLGWTSHELPTAGSVKLLPMPAGSRVRPSVRLDQTHAALAIDFSSHNASSIWLRCKHVTAKSLDLCGLGAWIVARTNDMSIIIGEILEILSDADMKHCLVVLDVFQVAAEADDRLGLPLLIRRHEERLVRIVNASFDFNVQHDCRLAQCTSSGRRPRIQERTETTHTESFIEHRSPARYLINMHGFHNAQLIRAVLPRALTAPLAIEHNPAAKHAALATRLRESQGQKRAAQKAKRDAKKANAAQATSTGAHNHGEASRHAHDDHGEPADIGAAHDLPPTKRKRGG